MSNLIALLFCLVVVAAAVVGMKFLIKQMSGMRAEVEAARAEFLQKVGYAWASALGGDPNRTRSKQTPSGVFTHTFDVRVEGSSTTTMQSWHLAARAPVHFQLVDKNLVSLGRAVLNVVGPISRTLTIRFPGPHLIGDPELDARFVLHTEHPQAAAALVRRAEVKSALAGLRDVSLLADETGLSFADPSDSNVYANGANRFDASPLPSIRAAITVHQRVEHLLTAIANAR